MAFGIGYAFSFFFQNLFAEHTTVGRGVGRPAVSQHFLRAQTDTDGARFRGRFGKNPNAGRFKMS